MFVVVLVMVWVPPARQVGTGSPRGRGLAKRAVAVLMGHHRVPTPERVAAVAWALRRPNAETGGSSRARRDTALTPDASPRRV
ncbi:MAG: hypothetical protein LKI60_04940 [Bifidobacterium tibiigranuli]|nr:hypothetical protein [Bifidobacterium tibiigranuli]